MGFFHCTACLRLYRVACHCCAFSEVPVCIHCAASADECRAVCERLEREARVADLQNITHEHHYTLFYRRPKDALEPLDAKEKADVLARVSWTKCPYCDCEQTRHKWVRWYDDIRPPGMYYRSCDDCRIHRNSRATQLLKLQTTVPPGRAPLFMCARCHSVVESHDATFVSPTHSIELRLPSAVRVFLLNAPCRLCVNDDDDERWKPRKHQQQEGKSPAGDIPISAILVVLGMCFMLYLFLKQH
jgi:hypothetical protein